MMAKMTKLPVQRENEKFQRKNHLEEGHVHLSPHRNKRQIESASDNLFSLKWGQGVSLRQAHED